MEPSFTITVKEQTSDYGLFVIEPLEQGYGHTMGSSLRRVLLTSLPGSAIVQVKIDKVRHPFSTLTGMKEDVTQLLLNIKKLRVHLEGKGPVKLSLDKTGPGEVRAGDIKTPPNVKIANPELVLANLANKDAKLSAELEVDSGRGYSLADERKTGLVGQIVLDALFSPVTRVNYRIEETRVGRLTNYDKLLLEIWTDATIKPFDALYQAANIIIAHFTQLVSPKVPKEAGVTKTEAREDKGAAYALSVEELNIPARVANALVRGGYETVGELVEAQREDLLKVRNLGEKSIKIVSAALGEHGITFPAR